MFIAHVLELVHWVRWQVRSVQAMCCEFKVRSQPQQKLGTHFLNNAKMEAFVY